MLREFRHKSLSYCISEVESSLDFISGVLLQSSPHHEASVMSMEDCDPETEELWPLRASNRPEV